jgi:predicted flap endonuclease-1-like 5' DNA nuclease
MGKRGPLVRVELEPGRFVKMHKEDAMARGLLAPKKRQPAGNKMRVPVANKAIVTGASDTSAGAFAQPEAITRVIADPEVPADIEADDFTAIDGIGEVMAAMLHERGILTLDELREVETCDLPARVAQAIERWRDGE